MEKEEKRITKRDNYEALKEIVEKSNVENAEMLVEFINKQIEMIDNKSAKAKVVARLTQLVNNGEAVKEQGKSEDNKKVMMYKLAD